MAKLFPSTDVKVDKYIFFFFAKPLIASVVSELSAFPQTKSHPNPATACADLRGSSGGHSWAFTASSGRFPLPLSWYYKKKAPTSKSFTQGRV